MASIYMGVIEVFQFFLCNNILAQIQRIGEKDL